MRHQTGLAGCKPVEALHVLAQVDAAKMNLMFLVVLHARLSGSAEAASNDFCESFACNWFISVMIVTSLRIHFRWSREGIVQAFREAPKHDALKWIHLSSTIMRQFKKLERALWV
jgi:hypothetical protein